MGKLGDLKLEDILKKEYRQKPSCRRAAQLTGVGIAADVAENFFDSDGLTSWIDWFTGLYILKCAGWSTGTIVLYHIVLLLGVITLSALLEPVIKSMMGTECKICTDRTTKRVGRKTKSVCEHERDGTPEECQSGSWIIAIILAVLVVALVNFIYMFTIKMKIFTPAGLGGTMLARMLV